MNISEGASDNTMEEIKNEHNYRDFEIAYISFRTKLNVLLDASDFKRQYKDFDNVMAGMFIYEVLMVIDRLDVNETKKVESFKEMLKMFQVDMATDEQYMQLYHVVRTGVGGWKDIIPYAAIPTDEYEIGTFWLFVFGAVVEGAQDGQVIIDLLELHAKYVLRFGEKMKEKYDLKKEYVECLTEYVTQTLSSVTAYLNAHSKANDKAAIEEGRHNEPSAIDKYKQRNETDIDKYKKYPGYKKLQKFLDTKNFTAKQKEIILLQYGAAFIKDLDRPHKDEVIGFVTENYPEILSCTDVVTESRPLIKFIWSFYKKDEELVDQVFDEQTFIYQKYNIEYAKCDYLIYVIKSYVDCGFDDDVFHSRDGQKVREEGYKPFSAFTRKMIPHGMRWHLYSNPEIDVSNLFCSFPIRILKLQTEEDVSRSKKGYRADLDMGFRSTWEANIARVLDFKNIKWKYETEFLPLDLSKEKVNISPNYLPDFVLDDGTIIEVKGFWDTRSKAKIKIASEQYQDRNILIIDSDFYRCIEKKYKDSILNWEESSAVPVSDVLQIVGITFSDRKPYVDKIRVGDKLILERDPENQYDKNAIKVKDAEGHVIGFISRDWAIILASKMDAGFRYSTTVKSKMPKVIQCDVNLINTDDMILPEIFM